MLGDVDDIKGLKAESIKSNASINNENKTTGFGTVAIVYVDEINDEIFKTVKKENVPYHEWITYYPTEEEGYTLYKIS